MQNSEVRNSCFLTSEIVISGEMFYHNEYYSERIYLFAKIEF